MNGEATNQPGKLAQPWRLDDPVKRAGTGREFQEQLSLRRCQPSPTAQFLPQTASGCAMTQAQCCGIRPLSFPGWACCRNWFGAIGAKPGFVLFPGRGFPLCFQTGLWFSVRTRCCGCIQTPTYISYHPKSHHSLATVL